MAKFYGAIGFSGTREIRPGVWTTECEEKEVYGEVIKDSRRFEKSESTNDSINISNRISILADNYILSNASRMAYVKWNNIKWKITSIDIEFPRIIMDLGGEYNESDDES